MKPKFFFPLFVLAAAAIAAEPPASENSALRLVGKISVPGMTGTWDHIGADGTGGRLFCNAQDIHALEVLDLRAQRVMRAVTGPFNRNQGIAFLPDLKKIVISNGRMIALCGVKDLVVVETADAILVCHRDAVQDIKLLTQQLPKELR